MNQTNEDTKVSSPEEECTDCQSDQCCQDGQCDGPCGGCDCEKEEKLDKK